MKEKRTINFRQYRIWIGLLAKRLLKQPVYIGLLVLIPVLGYAVGSMEQSRPQGAVAAVYVEEGTWSDQVIEGLRRQETDSVLRFVFCEDSQEVEQSVMKAEADCGFVIGADLAERVSGRDWRKSILMYETPASSIAGIAQERISGVVFRLYSEQCYAEYMRKSAKALQDGNMDVMPQEKSEEMTERFVDFAQDAYERHLIDDSTFAFRYENGNQYGQYKSDMNVINDTAVFPIKGVFAVIIFISGMCGMLEYDKDKREKRFLRMAPKTLTYIVDVWLPTVFVSAAVLVCLWISDGIRYGGSAGGSNLISGVLSVWSLGVWASQIGHLILYQGLILLYCCLLGTVLKRQETIAAAIPVLALGSLVCAPVFIRLGSYVAVFEVLEKLFPVSYYLMW